MSKILKTINIISYIFLVILSLCCAGVGGWLISQENWMITIFGINNIQILGWVLVATSILIFVTAIFGCCGTIKESRCCMITFLIIITVVFVLLAISGVLLFLYNNQVQGMLTSHVTKQFMSKYGYDSGFTMAWDEIQPKFKCCGINSGADYKSSQWYNRQSPEFHRDGEVPRSCCTRKPDGEFLNVTLCLKSRPEQGGPVIYNTGCWDVMQHQVSIVLFWTSIAVFALCGIVVLIIIFSCFMNLHINRNILYSQVV